MQDVVLNGVRLRSVSSKIIIHDVSESAPTFSYSAMDVGAGIGQMITGKRYQYRDITIKFAIADKSKDTPERCQILNDIERWMYHGGELRISDRADQHINVKAVTYPARPNSHKWNQDYTIVLRSYRPYWISDIDGFIGTKNGEYLYDGTAPAPIEVDGTTTASTVVISVDNSFIKFTGLTVGKRFVLAYDEYDRMVVTCNGTSCLAKLTTDSADALMLDCGLHTYAVSGLSAINVCSEVRYL